jgi:very-short-patch-repair endonuclease
MSVKRARHLRKNSTVAEKRLWAHLRNRKAAGLKFRRQQPMGERVLDFYCAEAKLAVELDGSGHSSHSTQYDDLDRELELYERDIRVLRFSNQAVLSDVTAVVDAIIYAADPERGE